MNDAATVQRPGSALLALITSPLAGLYFLLYRQYAFAVIHIGLYAGLFWGLCWAVLVVDLPFWYMTILFLVINGIMLSGIDRFSQKKQKAAGSECFVVFPLVSLLVVVLTVIIGCKAILDIREVVSSSMVPVITKGDYILIDHYAYQHSVPERGEIVMFYMPEDDKPDSGRPVIKRVAAVGGDLIYWHKDKMFVNGTLYGPSAGKIRQYKAINEDLEEHLYADYGPDDPFRVPDDDLFLIGDNYDDSYDSRHFGPISVDAVAGEVIQKIWPQQALLSLSAAR